MFKHFLLSSIVCSSVVPLLVFAQPQAGETRLGGVDMLHYVCEGGGDFTVRFENPDRNTSVAEVMSQSERVVLSDVRNHSAYDLTRVRSASGEKWSDGEWTYWSRGDEAMVQQGDDIIYSGCQIKEE